MKAGTLLLIVGDVIALLGTLGLITADGSLLAPSSAAQDGQLAAGVEAILVKHGVGIPAQANQVVQLIPIILSIAGVK